MQMNVERLPDCLLCFPVKLVLVDHGGTKEVVDQVVHDFGIRSHGVEKSTVNLLLLFFQKSGQTCCCSGNAM